MSNWNPRANEIFLEAQQCESAERRQAFLDEVCGPDWELREQVESLLEADLAAPSILDRHAAELVVSCPTTVSVGERIGPYKLVEQIGEGGMGVVFLAEQERPVRRKVALKIIKPGMDTREVVGRFEAERQALALMDHPNIAKVFDAGMVGSASRAEPEDTVSQENSMVRCPSSAEKSSSAADHQRRTTNQPRSEICNPKSEIPNSPGRPYFVMELVQGVPITEYCDQCQLTTRERLQLVVTVCRAVQHAHQKGIIHRDIKPTNILVAMQDGHPLAEKGVRNQLYKAPGGPSRQLVPDTFFGTPTPKIIDFGVAKAIGGRLTDRTLTTGFAQMLGTPLYMSPEQAELSPLGVDTRSDVYSLGVLLYELLTGATPFDKDRLHTTSYDEVRRIIREEEPPRPSTRISTLAADAATTIANHRRTDTRRLVQSVRGDLDWIVMKSLDKDRNRRYETAADFARDLERHLADEPVHARPPSRVYRLKKSIRKHRTSAAAAAAVLAALTMGVVFSVVGFARAVEERSIAERERDFAAAERTRAGRQLHRACELVNEVLQPAAYELQFVPRLQAVRANLLHEALRFYEGVAVTAGEDPAVRHGMAVALTNIAVDQYQYGGDGAATATRAVNVLRELAAEHPHELRYRRALGKAYYRLALAHEFDGRWRDVRNVTVDSVELYQQLIRHVAAVPEDRMWLAEHYRHRGQSLAYSGEWHRGIENVRTAVKLLDESAHDDQFHEMSARRALTKLLMINGRFEEAESEIEESDRIVQKLFAAASSARDLMLYRSCIGLVSETAGRHYMQTGRFQLAEDRLNNAIDSLQSDEEGFNELVWATSRAGWHFFHRGELYSLMGRIDEAVGDFQRALQWWEIHKGIPLHDYDAALAHWRLAELHQVQDKLTESEPHFEQALTVFQSAARRLPSEPVWCERLIVFLSNCPEESLRDPHEAARLAQRVVTDTDGVLYRYLGLARYRAGQWRQAAEAIRKGIALRNGGDAIDWLLLSACLHRQNRRTDALDTYLQAQQAIERGERIYYGHIGPLGFEQIRVEVEAQMQSYDEPKSYLGDEND